MASEDRRGWQTRGTRLSRPNGSQRLAGGVRPAQHHIQVTVLTRHDGHLQGATAIEVVQHELAVLIVASEDSGIAVDAKDRGRNLGAVLALSGKRTVILEFDIRKPKIMKGLGLRERKGITNYIVG